MDGRRVRTASRAVRAGQTVVVNLEEGGRAAAGEHASASSPRSDPGAARSAGTSSKAPAATARGAGTGPPLPADRILHLDRDLVAVDKPAGVAAQGTLTTGRALPDHVAGTVGGRAHLVHRLDRETSGVTVFGRSRRAGSRLSEAFREGRAVKVYLAICAGRPPEDTGRWDGPLARDPAGGGRFRVADGGVPAVTDWTVVETFAAEAVAGGLSCVRLEPQTGRTHQLRVHLAHAGAPILGDRRYGGPAFVTLADGRRIEPGRFLLHAWRLAVPHPKTGETATFEAPLPDDFRAVLEALGARIDPTAEAGA